MKLVSVVSIVLSPCLTERVVSFPIPNVRRRTKPSRAVRNSVVCFADKKKNHQLGNETPRTPPPTTTRNGQVPLDLTLNNNNNTDTSTAAAETLDQAPGQCNTSAGINNHQDDTKASELVNPLQAPSIILPASSEIAFLQAEASTGRFRNVFHDLTIAAVVGSVTGLLVALFKFSIQAVQSTLYGPTFWLWPALIPAFGGLVVGFLSGDGPFSAGLRDTVHQVDAQAPQCQRPWSERTGRMVPKARQSFRNTAAAVVTLGSGCSLGPEGPCVQIGVCVARSCTDTLPRRTLRHRKGKNRRLLSCGAAAGVAAGFNAPIAGVFFALEIMQNTFDSVDEAAYLQAVEERNRTSSGRDRLLDGDYDLDSWGSSSEGFTPSAVLTGTERITPILVASVMSALVARTLLGSHYVLQLGEYSLQSPLPELPLYFSLGAVSGCVAFGFSETAKFCKQFLDGEIGPEPLQSALQTTPGYIKPVFGGLFCGVVGLLFPQILFFGYETLNSLLAPEEVLSTQLVVSLLVVKTITTAVSAGSGLVGGTFAPALFLGAMTGAAFHNVFAVLLENDLVDTLQGTFGTLPGMADVPAYAMIGAASVLAALFRAPLTASMVLFELTRDYEVLLPLMASAGLGSLVVDILDDRFEQVKARRRDQDEVSWGELSSRSNLQQQQQLVSTAEEDVVITSSNSRNS